MFYCLQLEFEDASECRGWSLVVGRAAAKGKTVAEGNFTRSQRHTWDFRNSRAVAVSHTPGWRQQDASLTMPPSQLKRLKVSLRNEGIVGPQQSKKQKKRAATNGVATEKRAQRSVALQAIREQFNPFEVQAPSRGRDKFEVLNNRTLGGRVTKGIKGRPGVTKGYGEETVCNVASQSSAFALANTVFVYREGKPCSRKCNGGARSVAF